MSFPFIGVYFSDCIDRYLFLFFNSLHFDTFFNNISSLDLHICSGKLYLIVKKKSVVMRTPELTGLNL